MTFWGELTMKPMDDSFTQQDMNGDMEQILAEIDGMPPLPHPNAIVWTAQQDKCLIALRQKGFSWPFIARWWKGRGWKGCADTLSSRYKEIKS